jgi:cysteinyl-tRNA synthetase
VSLRIYDTMSRTKKEFTPVKPGAAGIYCCGMTVQDKPHVGHVFSAIVGDTIRRYLEHRGFDVTYVYNFTDVDDKIIARAHEEKRDWRDIADENMQAYLNVAATLNIKPATHYPKATEHIDEIVNLVRLLEEKGYAYKGGSDVYFDVAKCRGYGKLSGRKLDELRAGARIEVGEQKNNPLDFALWKGAKEGEPSWDSPWGKGRPGWHIECSAMSMKYIGSTLDIHCGGQDLIFPHHENEIAQSECATGVPFVRYWVHNGFVNLAGEKMSKSTKHFYLAENLCREFDPEAIRFYLLSTHYRSPIEFGKERLLEAGAALGRLRNSIRLALAGEAKLSDGAREGHVKDAELEAAMGQAAACFDEAMDDDFNTAKAVACLFDLSKKINLALEGDLVGPATLSTAANAARELMSLGGVLGLTWKGMEAEEEPPDEISALVKERDQARRDKDWAKADELREAISRQGFVVEDRADGPQVRRKES